MRQKPERLLRGSGQSGFSHFKRRCDRLAWRHECKIEINAADLQTLRSRLRVLMTLDAHTIDGKYRIRSLYFDSPSDRALREKTDGVNRREKFRIRYYNGDTDFLQLEKKSKLNSLCQKQSVQLTIGTVHSILRGDLMQPTRDDPPLLQELLVKMKTQRLRPKVVVDYIREPYVFGPGHVRVTFDSAIRTSLKCRDFLSANLVTIPAGDAPILMEIKWDAFLPDVIRQAIGLTGRNVSAFSKYAQCRIYG